MSVAIVVERGAPVPVVVTGGMGGPGPTGPTGGNVMAIGLFTAAPGIAVGAGTTLVQTSGYAATGKGHGLYVHDAAVDAAWVAARPRVGFIAADGRGFRLSRDQRVTVTMLGATGLGVADDTEAFNAASTYMGENGGGKIFVPKGTYLLDDSNTGATNWDNHRAIYIGHDDVYFEGEGEGSVVKLGAGADCHVFKFGSRETVALPINGGGVDRLTIDGNRANQGAPTQSTNHWQGVDVSSGSQRIQLTKLYIHDCQYYGIGFQRTGIKDCLVEDVVIENTGADGIDCKNDDGDGTGNVIRNAIVRNFGLRSDVISTPQAGIDVRSGWYVDNPNVLDMTASTDLVGVRVLPDGDGSGTGVPKQPSKVNNPTVEGNDGVSQIGIRLASRNSQVSNATIRHCSDGIRVSRADCLLSNIDVQSNTAAGIRLTADATVPMEANDTVINGLICRDNARGIVYDAVSRVTVNGAIITGSTLEGHDIRTGCTGIKILGGAVSGNSADVGDLGTGTIVRDVDGYKTKSAVSGNAAIDATGVKSVIIAHGLEATPAVADVILTLDRVNNVTDWEAKHPPWVVGTDANNISCQINIKTASATAGAVVAIRATINTKDRA